MSEVVHTDCRYDDDLEPTTPLEKLADFPIDTYSGTRVVQGQIDFLYFEAMDWPVAIVRAAGAIEPEAFSLRASDGVEMSPEDWRQTFSRFCAIPFVSVRAEVDLRFEQFPIIDSALTGFNFDFAATHFRELAKRVDAFVQTVDRNYLPEIKRLEERDPGNRFGERVYHHQKEFANELAVLGKDLGLSPSETLLLMAAACAHDTGRTRDELRGENDLRPVAGHGLTSVEMLEEWEAFSSFVGDDAQCVREGILSHSEIESSCSSESSTRIADVLRDFGDYRILTDPTYSSPSGISAQIRKWYISESDRELFDAIPKAVLFAEIEKALGGSAIKLGEEVSVPAESKRVFERVQEVLHAPLSAESLERFGDLTKLPKTSIEAGWSNYMLLHVALVSGMQSTELISNLLENGDLAHRIDTFRRTTDSRIVDEKIVTPLASFLKDRLPESGGIYAV